MFKRDQPKEPVEVTALREALESKDVKVTVQDKQGNAWTFYNDKLRGCFITVGRPKVIEQPNGEDTITKFCIYATNGRVDSA